MGKGLWTMFLMYYIVAVLCAFTIVVQLLFDLSFVGMLYYEFELGCYSLVIVCGLWQCCWRSIFSCAYVNVTGRGCLVK